MDTEASAEQRLIRRNTLGDLLRRNARRNPAKTAVIFGSQSLSYREWNEHVNQVARGLSRLGVAQGHHIGIAAGNSLNFATLIMAIAKLGAVAVPVNPTLTASDMAFILDNGDVDWVAADYSRYNPVDEALSHGPAMKGPKIVLDNEATGWIPFVQCFDPDCAEWFSDVDDNDVAQILYTSGTKSRPKGVMLTHRNLIDQFASIIVAGEFRPEDVVLHALPLYHSAQLNAFFGAFLHLGATHVITQRPEPSRILDLIEQHQVTEFFAPPTVWIGILRSPSFNPERLRSLSKAVYGAAIMPVDILGELSRTLPWVRFWNMYGMTEVAPFATALEPREQLNRPRSVGKPGINVEMAVLRDDGTEAVPNELGEIAFRTSHALVGYYKAPDKTREAFQYGWYHTGDVGFIDEEGYLTVVDRKKDMIKTGGENVASREVEDVLYGHPAVQECAVVGVEDPYWIEAVTAIVVPRAGLTVGSEELLAYCRQHLAHFKVPKQIVFRQELPKNPTGKILKRALKLELREET